MSIPYTYLSSIKQWCMQKVASIPPRLFDWEDKTLEILGTQKGETKTCTRINLKERTFYVIPKLQRAHFISDPETIKEFFHHGRNSEMIEPGFSAFVEPVIGKDNLLLCPNESHRRLRTPLEKPLTYRSLVKKENLKEVALLGFKLLDSQILQLSDLAYAAVSSVLGVKNDLDYYVQVLRQHPTEVRKAIFNAFLKEIYDQKSYSSQKGMELLQQAHEKGNLNEEEKYSSTTTLFIAGTHTTQQFLSIFIKMMQLHPECRKKIEKEWRSFVKDSNVTFSTKEELADAIAFFAVGGEKEGKKYLSSESLKRCYFETLRLYPIFPEIRRIAKTTGQIGNVSFSQGDEIHLNILAYQRDPEVWGKDSQTFNPERFKEEGLSSKLYSFGLGPQSCIGKHLVQIESLIFMSELVVMHDWQEDAREFKYEYNGFNAQYETLYVTKRFRLKPEFNHIF